MDTQSININLPLDFNQLIEMIKQLPLSKKLELKEVLIEEIEDNDKIKTYTASESTLLKDWMLQEEEEAWKNL
jgi:hypothetical protein